MTYNATYTADDMSSIGLDVVGNFGAKFVPYISLILLIFLFVWVKRHVK